MMFPPNNCDNWLARSTLAPHYRKPSDARREDYGTEIIIHWLARIYWLTHIYWLASDPAEFRLPGLRYRGRR